MSDEEKMPEKQGAENAPSEEKSDERARGSAGDAAGENASESAGETAGEISGEIIGRSQSKDIVPLLKGWDYEPGTINVRKISGLDDFELIAFLVIQGQG